MENKKVVNWEKIGIYFACLSVSISLFTFLVAQQIQISDCRERIAKLEVKVEHLEDK
jgi:hypothetical protein